MWCLTTGPQFDDAAFLGTQWISRAGTPAFNLPRSFHPNTQNPSHHDQSTWPFFSCKRTRNTAPSFGVVCVGQGCEFCKEACHRQPCVGGFMTESQTTNHSNLV
jgi:hypothetical protein